MTTSTTTTPTTRTARLEARLPADTYALLKRAAEIDGRSLSDFVVAAAAQAARQMIESTEVIRLSRAAQEQLVDLLLNPPQPKAKVRLFDDQVFERQVDETLLLHRNGNAELPGPPAPAWSGTMSGRLLRCGPAS